MQLPMLLPLDLLWGAAKATSPQLAPSFATAIDNTESCSPRWQLLLTFSWDYSWALLRPLSYHSPLVLPMQLPLVLLQQFASEMLRRLLL